VKRLNGYKNEILISVILIILIVTFPAVVISQPAPIYPRLSIIADINSAKNFSYVTKQIDNYTSKVLVIPPGSSGTIPVTLIQITNRTYELPYGLEELYIHPVGVEERLFEWKGIQFNFTPNRVSPKPYEEIKSVLKLEVEPNAPTGFYTADVSINCCVFYGINTTFDFPMDNSTFDFLILPYTPSYLFYIYASSSHISTSSSELSTPTIKVDVGREAYVMFGIYPTPKDTDSIAYFDYTYNSKPWGSMPSGVGVTMLSNPLQVTRLPEEKFYTLKLSASPSASEGVYKMLVTSNVGSFVFERLFYLVVSGYTTTTQTTTTTTTFSTTTTTISTRSINEINRFIPLFGIIIFIAVLVALYIRKIV